MEFTERSWTLSVGEFTLERGEVQERGGARVGPGSDLAETLTDYPDGFLNMEFPC